MTARETPTETTAREMRERTERVLRRQQYRQLRQGHGFSRSKARSVMAAFDAELDAMVRRLTQKALRNVLHNA